MARIAYRALLPGVDTIEVNAKGPLLDGVPEFLDTMQQAAMEERDLQPHRKQRQQTRLETMWEIAGQPLLIAPYGVRQGMYQFTMSCPALTVDIGNGSLNDITAEIRLSSPFLWEFGYRQAWEQVKALMREIGDFSYQISEIHLCVDVAGMLVDRLKRQEFVGRGHITRWHEEDALIVDLAERRRKGENRPVVEVVTRYGQVETIRFSPRSAMSGTVYDKLREIRFHSPDKLWFLDLWKKAGWDEISPIARVEMRPERDVLREMGIETPEEAFDRLDYIWAYATQQWIRHTTPTGDKTRSRWPSSPFWQVVQGAVFEREHADPAQRQKVRAFRERQMLGALLGYLESWAAWRAESDDDTPDISIALRDIAEKADDHYLEKDSDFWAEVVRKRRKFGFAS
jgi:hypothetical protein